MRVAPSAPPARLGLISCWSLRLLLDRLRDPSLADVPIRQDDPLRLRVVIALVERMPCVGVRDLPVALGVGMGPADGLVPVRLLELEQDRPVRGALIGRL